MTLAYTATNWSSEFRLASSSDARSEWDNVRVATTFAEASGKGIVFADNFSESNGTLLNGKAPDVGGANWNVTAGGGTLDVQSNTVDTSGGGRAAFGTFTQALGSNETLVLDFETLDTAGAMFTSGFAGISLFEGGTERIFIGDRGDSTAGWGLAQSGLTFQSSNTSEAIVGKFVYDFDSGNYMFLINGLLVDQGSIAAGFALDNLRFANGGGGDIAVSDLVVSIVVPAPAALPAGLTMIGIFAARRRRRAG